MSKYIVKNCPAIEFCSCGSVHHIPDCPIKQIVAKCQEFHTNLETLTLAKEVLNLLDVEEHNMSKCKDKVSE